MSDRHRLTWLSGKLPVVRPLGGRSGPLALQEQTQRRHTALIKTQDTGEGTPSSIYFISVYRRYVWAYLCRGAGLDDPGVLGPDEAQAVEGGQVTVDLLLQAPLGAHLPAQAHAVLKHYRPR